MIQFTVEDRNGNRQTLDAPDDMNLSLMETLKAFDYPVLATCGGMALCATCHVKFLEGLDKLPPRNNAEIEMLDTLPDADDTSRLSCQLRVDGTLENSVFKICGEEQE